MPEEVKMRDKKAMARYGTLNPALQGTTKIAGPANVDRHALPEASKEPELSPQQADILAKIMRGENFFFTGSAGTGKSVLLRAIILAFKKKRAELKNKPNTGVIPWELAITASTGMAGL
jgi:ATP-dependent DNA helicase PIF1